MNKLLVCIGIIGTVFLCTSCDDKVTIPKPRMYPRIEFPQKNFKTFLTDYCELKFSFPDYGVLQKDTLFFDEQPAHPCWFSLEMDSLNAQLHCSYYNISKKDNFDKLLLDAFNLAGKHNIKANYRKESVIESPQKKVYGLLFDIEGPVATPLQFYLTDSTTHFFRASLYFYDKVNPDSTQILVDFIRPDILHLIETFEWK